MELLAEEGLNSGQAGGADERKALQTKEMGRGGPQQVPDSPQKMGDIELSGAKSGAYLGLDAWLNACPYDLTSDQRLTIRATIAGRASEPQQLAAGSEAR
jgi:hypothetical protein